MLCPLPLALAFWLMLSLPTGMSNTAAFFAIIGTSMLFDTFATLVVTAYYAMTAELSTDYTERTSISTYRMVFNSVGYIFGAAVTTILATAVSDSMGGNLRAGWSTVGLAFGILGMITVLIPGLFVKQGTAVSDEPTKLPPVKAIVGTFKNKPFMKYLLISSIMSTAFTLVTAMLPYFLKYYMHMEAQQSLIMMMLLVVLTLCIVPCAKVANRIGKAKTYALGITIACALLILWFFLPGKASIWVYILAGIIGLGFSAQWVCPHSMMPDVIEYDELATGERREGIYYGMNNMAGKVTGALGTFICGWGLQLTGYVENAEQTTTALLGIRIMFCVLPAVLLLICVPLLLKYPITKESHAEVVRQLEERHAAENKSEE